MRDSATAFAPGSVGNVGPGLDILGLAVAGRGDSATLGLSGDPGIVIAESGDPELTSDPLRHATAIAIKEVFTLAGYRGGAILRVTKGLVA